MRLLLLKPNTLFFVVLISALLSLPAFADVEKFYGRAVNEKGELIFIEEHTIRYQNQRIAAMKTTYYNEKMNKIGELVSDFSAGAQFGSYDFKDNRAQYADGAKVLSDRILIYRQKTPDDEISEKFLERNANQIVGQGFHPFIQANIDKLVDGDVISAKLVLPAQMNQFEVQIRKKKVVNGSLSVRIELSNWFLRLFAPHVEADYDIETRQLLSYRGVSVISDESGKTVQVAVSYDYSQQNIRASFRDKSEPARLEPN